MSHVAVHLWRRCLPNFFAHWPNSISTVRREPAYPAVMVDDEMKLAIGPDSVSRNDLLETCPIGLLFRIRSNESRKAIGGERE